MKMQMCRSVLPVLGLLFWLVMPAAGQDVTVFAGALVPGNLTEDNLRTSLDNGPVWGFRLSTSFVPMLGLEHTLAFSPDYLAPSRRPAGRDAKGLVYSTNLIVNLPTGAAVPYLTAGVGLIRQYGSSDLPVGTKFAFNYGGGLKAPRMWGPFGLRFDARGYTATGVVSRKLNIFELSAGVLFSF